MRQRAKGFKSLSSMTEVIKIQTAFLYLPPDLELYSVTCRTWAKNRQLKQEFLLYKVNMLLTCLRTGILILEEEIETIYIDGNASSHFDTVKDSWCV